MGFFEHRRLKKGASSADPSVRAETATALASSDDKDADSMLVALFGDSHADVQARATEALMQRALRRYGDVTVKALLAVPRATTATIFRTLAEHYILRLCQPRISASTSLEWSDAMRSLGYIKDRRAIGPLLHLIASGDRSDQMHAANALGDVGREFPRDVTSAVDAFLLEVEPEKPWPREGPTSPLPQQDWEFAVQALSAAIGPKEATIRLMAASVARMNVGRKPLMLLDVKRG